MAEDATAKKWEVFCITEDMYFVQNHFLFSSQKSIYQNNVTLFIGYLLILRATEKLEIVERCFMRKEEIMHKAVQWLPFCNKLF